MKISILVIAHNEETCIALCIESLLKQTQKPDEIVLIAHNCTDQTEEIARRFPIRIVSLKGPEGIPYARIKGFEEVSGDIIACIDGDAWAKKSWLVNITRPLIRNPYVTLVTGYAILINNFFGRFSSFWQFVINRKLLNKKSHRFAWGSNFACRKVDYEAVGGIAPILQLKEKLNLHFWAEDVYLSLALLNIGVMYTAIDAKIYTTIPKWKLNPKTAPIKEWYEDNKALFTYFDTGKGM